jgi:hypothetical protein
MYLGRKNSGETTEAQQLRADPPGRGKGVSPTCDSTAEAHVRN